MATQILKADLHSHTYHSFDGLTSPGKFVSACLSRGINCVAITEHNNIKGALAIKRLAPFKIIVGEEIRTRDGEIIGLFLQAEVPPGLSAEETVTRIKDQGGVVSIPHAFDRFRSGLGEETMLRILPQIDIIESFNARNLLPGDNARARRFAREHGIPAISVSDSHSPCELGRSHIEIAGFDTPAEFLAAVRQAKLIKRHANPLIHLTSRWAVTRRKLMGWRPVE